MSEANAKKCVIVGSETENDQLAVKNMDDGRQELIAIDDFLQNTPS